MGNERRRRDPLRTSIFGAVLVVFVMLIAAGYPSPPFWPQGRIYTAYFANAAGLTPGDDVRIYGYDVGKVLTLELCDSGARVGFTVRRDYPLGDQSLAAIRTDTVLGQRSMAITPSGTRATTAIPLARTTTPYTLSGALQDIGRSATDIDQGRFTQALSVLTEALQTATPQLKGALDGLGALSHSVNVRDREVDELLTHAHAVSAVAADRADQLTRLITDGDALFAELHARQQALGALIHGIQDVARQISGFVDDNRREFGPALQKLNLVLENLNAHRTHLDEALRRLPGFSTTLAEVVGAGPGFNANIFGVPPAAISAMLLDSYFQPGKMPDSLRDFLSGLISERLILRPKTP